MKSITRLVLAAVATLVVAAAGAATFGLPGATAPEPVAAYSDPVIRELHRDVRPRVWQLPNGMGLLITVQAITTVDANATPAAADGALPSSFRVERKGGATTDFTTITNSNPNARGKLKHRDGTPFPNQFHNYRIVVVYPNGHEVALRESKQKHVQYGGAEGGYDIRMQATSVSNGIEISWRPVLWEANDYEVRRAPPGGSNFTAVGTVNHSAGGRLSIVDDAAVSGQSYDYQVNARHASLGSGGRWTVTVTTE